MTAAQGTRHPLQDAFDEMTARIGNQYRDKTITKRTALSKCLTLLEVLEVYAAQGGAGWDEAGLWGRWATSHLIDLEHEMQGSGKGES